MINILLILLAINCGDWNSEFDRQTFERVAITYAKIINPTIDDDRLGRIDDPEDAPLSLVRTVWYTSLSFNIDPYLVWAICRVESDFKNIPRHPHGECGYFGEKLGVASWIVGRLITRDELVRDWPMQVGIVCKLLRFLKDHYKKVKWIFEKMIMAYQKGMNGLRELLKVKGENYKTSYYLKVNRIYQYLISESDKVYREIIR